MQSIQVSDCPSLALAQKYIDTHILPEIVAAKPACGPYGRLLLRLLNTSPHAAVLTTQKQEENRIVAFSLDLSPSDFFLLGALNG
jgi:hypothetical protein